RSLGRAGLPVGPAIDRRGIPREGRGSKSADPASLLHPPALDRPRRRADRGSRGGIMPARITVGASQRRAFPLLRYGAPSGTPDLGPFLEMENSVMNRITAIALGLMLAAWSAPVVADQGHHMAGQKSIKRTITGELVDTGCYLGHGARGEKHVSCASK